MRNEIPWREYRSLRPADLKKPEYRHLWWLLYWPIELSFFALAGRLPWHYHPIYSTLDDWIPFSEVWVIPYCLWFFCVVFTVLYTLSRDIRVFRRFTDYMMVTILLAGAVYLVYPNFFPGRPVQALGWPGTLCAYYDAMPRKNLFTFALSFIYLVDPPRNACPSEHAVVALGMAFAVLDSKKLRKPAFSVPLRPAIFFNAVQDAFDVHVLVFMHKNNFFLIPCRIIRLHTYSNFYCFHFFSFLVELKDFLFALLL